MLTYLGALEGDGTKLLGERVGEEDSLQGYLAFLIRQIRDFASLLHSHGCGPGKNRARLTDFVLVLSCCSTSLREKEKLCI